mgnify:CR=1 FL=1
MAIQMLEKSKDIMWGIKKNKKSITGAYLSGQASVAEQSSIGPNPANGGATVSRCTPCAIRR